VHKVQVDVIQTQRFEGSVDSLLDTFVPWVVKLGSDPDLTTWDARVFDALSDFMFVLVRHGPVEIEQSSYHWVAGVALTCQCDDSLSGGQP